MTKFLRIGHNLSGGDFLYLEENGHVVKMDEALVRAIAVITGLHLGKSQGMIPIGMLMSWGI